MTPPERASWLIKELKSVEKAMDYVTWVKKGAVKEVTREYWGLVLEELKKKNLVK